MEYLRFYIYPMCKLQQIQCLNNILDIDTQIGT